MSKRARYFDAQSADARIASMLFLPEDEGDIDIDVNINGDSHRNHSADNGESRKERKRRVKRSRKLLKELRPTVYQMEKLKAQGEKRKREAEKKFQEAKDQVQQEIAEQQQAAQEAERARQRTAAASRKVGGIGPVPLPKIGSTEIGGGDSSRDYGGNLLAGEGDAIAQYVQAGVRIPRRGEIGLTGPEIESFENAGFVMSGSRHRRMNAIRMRKEAQVLDAEEKWTLTQAMMRDRHAKEAKLINDLARSTKNA